MTESMPSAEAFSERLFASILGAYDIAAIYMGGQLGYYRALSDGDATSDELAQRTGTAERHTREWLEHQAVSGVLAVPNPEASALGRRYHLPADYIPVLLDPESLANLMPMARLVMGCFAPMPQILDAYRSGAGVPYEDYGADLAEGQAGTTYPQFMHLLAQEWIPAMPDIHERLSSASLDAGGKPVRIADIGMGLGWSSIALASAFSDVWVDGFDLDPESIAAARHNAEIAGVADRVAFHCRDAGDPALGGQYDFALAVECVHDMSDPIAVLASMRRLVGEGGTVLVVDERVADTFEIPASDVDRLMYGFSITHCLLVGMVDQPSAATGTVMRAPTLRSYAMQAGFRSVRDLPIENEFFRFYRLDA